MMAQVIYMAGSRTCIIAAFALIQTAILLLSSANSQASATETTRSSVEPAIDDGVQVYPRAFFNRFNPQTARDMINRLPGFMLDLGDDDLRGFGKTAGNVLIDDERPSSKKGGIEDALNRIPAAQVERIEVIRGSAGASEASGQAVVANVIRTRGSQAGTWEFTLERAADGSIYPIGEITYARRFGGWDVSTKVNAFWERYPLEGPRMSRDADGILILSQIEDRKSLLEEAFISLEAKRGAGGGVLTLTGRFGRSALLPDTERLGFDGRLPDESPDERLFIDFDSIFIDGELGVDWSRPVGGDWAVKLLSLSSYRDIEQRQLVSTERPIGDLRSASDFDAFENKFETVFRATVGRGGERRFKPEFGGEVAYNRLDSALRLVTEENGISSSISLPAADVLVEETRADVFANIIWKAAESLTVETGLAAEVSKIAVSGDAENTQGFFFAKPFATLIYDARPSLQFRLGARRSVGQLDFSDFAASAEAEDDRFLGGNPELEPDKTTRLSLTTDLRSENNGALNVELFHEWRSDVLEQIVLPSGASGTANTDDARVWGVTANAALPLDFLIPGGLIEVGAEVSDSEFNDPITGQSRVLSDLTTPKILAEFRQDLPEQKFSWGFSYRAAEEHSFFFTNEESFNRDGDVWSFFVETTRFAGLRTNLSLRNIGERNFYRERVFYDPDRSGPQTGSEVISRDRGMFISLTVSGQF